MLLGDELDGWLADLLVSWWTTVLTREEKNNRQNKTNSQLEMEYWFAP